MNNFIFENSSKVYFGEGCVKEYLSNTLDNDLLIPFIKFNIINNNLKELAESTEEKRHL